MQAEIYKQYVLTMLDFKLVYSICMRSWQVASNLSTLCGSYFGSSSWQKSTLWGAGLMSTYTNACVLVSTYANTHVLKSQIISIWVGKKGSSRINGYWS